MEWGCIDNRIDELCFPESTFPGRLKKVMKERKLKRWELSKISGVRVEAINKYLMGDCVPRADSLQNICKALNVTMDWLFCNN